MMKSKKYLSIALLTLSFSSFQALAEDYVIDDEGAHAFVQFKATHLGYSYVIGRFNTFEGTFSYDANDPSSANVNVTIEVDSIDTNHAERDNHLRGEDFFDSDEYPQITFASTSFAEESDGSVTIVGDLSLHGVTKSITINGRHIGHGDDPWGGYRRGLEGELALDSTQYGFPGWVGDVEIYLVVEGIRQ